MGTLDQAVEQGLGLGVDPVQSSQTRSRGCTWLSRSSTRLSAVSVRWRRCGGSSRRNGLSSGRASSSARRAGCILERFIKRQRLPGHLSANGAGVVVLLDVGVALEQVNDREIRGGLAIGDRGALQHQPGTGAVRVDKLVHQARLAHTGLADQRHHLAVPRPRPLLGVAEGVEFRLPPHKGESAPRHGSLTTADCTGPDQLEHLHRLR